MANKLFYGDNLGVLRRRRQHKQPVIGSLSAVVPVNDDRVEIAFGIALPAGREVHLKMRPVGVAFFGKFLAGQFLFFRVACAGGVAAIKDEEFDRCKSDLAKILGEIERLKQTDFSCDGLMHLSVLCREAASLLPPTQHYLEARERVRKFEESTTGAIDHDTARALATIIEGMVAGR